MRDAMLSLEGALGVWGGRGVPGDREAWGGDCLREALRLLEAPSAKSAASSLILFGDVSQSCDQDALGAVKAAKKAVRDVVVLRCCCQVGTVDRSAFLEAAEEAFGSGLDRELRAQLLLAFHKIAKNKPDTFLSNSQQATNRRGYPRPRRQPRSSEIDEDASAEAFFRFLTLEP